MSIIRPCQCHDSVSDVLSGTMRRSRFNFYYRCSFSVSALDTLEANMAVPNAMYVWDFRRLTGNYRTANVV